VGFAFLVCLLAGHSKADELKVTQYGGPTECEDSDRVKKGDQLGMHYTGTIDASSKTGEAGKQFDSSRDRGDVFETQIGVGEVIDGWDKGLIGLCKGAKATLVIPPEMGYGDMGAGGDIPGGATLNFDVEVMSISEGLEFTAEGEEGQDDEAEGEEGQGGDEGDEGEEGEEGEAADTGLGEEDQNLFAEIDTSKDGKLSRDEVLAHLQSSEGKVEDAGNEMIERIWESEDKDKDGFISWHEFTGPKGDTPPHEEL